MEISACVIAKNESEHIGICLEKLRKYGFEIIVVDTGSTDNTKEIALAYTSQVYDYPWKDDFASARNFAISKSSNEYILSIDCDEYIEEMDADTLKQSILNHPEEIGRIKITNIFHQNGIPMENTEWLKRIFSKKTYHFEGKIHEQIVAINMHEKGSYDAPIQILHVGYDISEEKRKIKAIRNIALLQKELEDQISYFKDKESVFYELSKQQITDSGREMYLNLVEDILYNNNNISEKFQKDTRIPYTLYQLGKSYYMAGNNRIAAEYFSCALCFDLDPKLEYVVDMVQTYGYALINSGQAEKALAFENIYEEFGNTADFMFLMGLIYMNNAHFENAIDEFQKATAMKEERIKGVNSYLANYNIGVIYECLGYIEDAENYYRECGEYKPAKKRLDTIEERKKQRLV